MSNFFDHDPNAVLDYKWDWSDWLTGDDTIDSHTIVISPEGGVTKNSSTNDTTSVTVWISGGTAGAEVVVTCQIVTAQGRKDDRLVKLSIKDR